MISLVYSLGLQSLSFSFLSIAMLGLSVSCLQCDFNSSMTLPQLINLTNGTEPFNREYHLNSNEAPTPMVIMYGYLKTELYDILVMYLHSFIVVKFSEINLLSTFIYLKKV